ncbi:Fic family protein [Streptomyces thinghirensis]|uniref:Fido domain-containing protein n=1 Tax=Streptomyces thinghirensis TaxID=551547 RepID=A0ABP9SY56_9ACTN
MAVRTGEPPLDRTRLGLVIHPAHRFGLQLEVTPGPCEGDRPSTSPVSLLHGKAAASRHSVARDHALIDGNERTARLAMRVFLRFNGVSASTPPPPVCRSGFPVS